MATKKQIGMMLARAKDAGMDVKTSELEELDNGGVDQMLEKIRHYAATKKNVESAAIPFAKPDISDIRFGMCCKIVFQEYGIAYMLGNPDMFQDSVDRMYKLVTDVFNAAREKRKASPDDRDYKAEMAEKRALESVGGD